MKDFDFTISAMKGFDFTISVHHGGGKDLVPGTGLPLLTRRDLEMQDCPCPCCFSLSIPGCFVLLYCSAVLQCLSRRWLAAVCIESKEALSKEKFAQCVDFWVHGWQRRLQPSRRLVDRRSAYIRLSFPSFHSDRPDCPALGCRSRECRCGATPPGS